MTKEHVWKETNQQRDLLIILVHCPLCPSEVPSRVLNKKPRQNSEHWIMTLEMHGCFSAKYSTSKSCNRFQGFNLRIGHHEALGRCLLKHLTQLWVLAMGVECFLASVSVRMLASVATYQSFAAWPTYFSIIVRRRLPASSTLLYHSYPTVSGSFSWTSAMSPDTISRTCKCVTISSCGPSTTRLCPAVRI